jgi:hypothetical protein
MKPEDFEELLANCADEPIRFPGAIQPHGALLTLREPDLQIVQVSANVASLFNHPPETLLGQPLDTLLGADNARTVQQIASQLNFIDAPALHVTLNGNEFEGLLHRHQGVLVLEFEPRYEHFQPKSVNGRASNLGKMLQRLQSAKTLQALYEISVSEIQAMTGYDRVLIYRFRRKATARSSPKPPRRRWSCSTGCSSRPPTFRNRPASCTAPLAAHHPQCRLRAGAAATQAAPGHRTTAGFELRGVAQRVADPLPVHEEHGRAVVHEYFADGRRANCGA